MVRQSISLTDPNDSWLKDQIAKEEFSSKSELINALVRKARHEDERRAYVCAKLKHAEDQLKVSGYSDLSMTELLEKSRADLRKNGEL